MRGGRGEQKRVNGGKERKGNSGAIMQPGFFKNL